MAETSPLGPQPPGLHPYAFREYPRRSERVQQPPKLENAGRQRWSSLHTASTAQHPKGCYETDLERTAAYALDTVECTPPRQRETCTVSPPQRHSAAEYAVAQAARPKAVCAASPKKRRAPRVQKSGVTPRVQKKRRTVAGLHIPMLRSPQRPCRPRRRRRCRQRNTPAKVAIKPAPSLVAR